MGGTTGKMVPEFEHQNGLNDRRSFMKLLAAAPLFATIGTRSVAAAVSNAARWKYRRRGKLSKMRLTTLSTCLSYKPA